MMSTVTDGSVIGTSSGLRERQSSSSRWFSRPMHGNELVHDAARHAGEFVLGLLAEQRLFHRIEFLAGDGFQQRGGGDFQRGAAGKSAAQRHGGMQPARRAAGIEAARQKAGDDAARIICPVAPRKRFERAADRSIMAGLSLWVERSRIMFRVWIRPVGGHDGVTLNGHRQDKAVVVIGVFADDVDAAGRGDNPARRTAVNLGELLGRLSGQVL